MKRIQTKPEAKKKTAPITQDQNDEPLIERLRGLCMSYPEAIEKRSHGEPTWFAGKGKVFAMLDNYHHGAEHLAVWLPQPAGAQHTRIEEEPTRYFKPPYVGVKGWVGVVLDDDTDWGALSGLLRDAYVLVATARRKAKL
jgi:predicted DNA-binding protein (MmcQ/YjbR family)